MTGTYATLAALAALAFVACSDRGSSTATAPEAGTDTDASAPVADAGATDADAHPSHLPVLPVALPPLSTIPLLKPAILPVSTGAPFDYDGALLEDTATGHVAVVFDRFVSETVFLAELRIAELDETNHFGPSTRVALAGLASEPLVAGAHVLVSDGDTFLYFMHGDQAKNHTRLARSRFVDGAFEPSEDLALADPFTGMLAWPCAVVRGSEIALAYDHYQMGPHVARGDGKTFGADTELASGVQGRVASFADGTLAATWQNGDQANMIAYVRISHDGTAWTPALPITAKANVHDVTPFRRADGGVDVYYISDDGAAGFRIFRRAVRLDATLGAEELVSDESAGHFTQPHPHRLHDGSIGLVFAVQVTSNVDTDTAMARITGDAPP